MEGNGKPSEKQLSEIDAYLENMRIMQGIVAEMKEIPVLPSEKPQDINALTRVEFPEAGGVLTYMDGYEYPYRGFPSAEVVEKIDLIKKLSRAMASGLYHSLKRHPWLMITLLPVVWVFKDLLYTGVSTFARTLERVRLKPHRYSQPIRELHRAFSEPRAQRGEDEHTQELRLMLRDIVCMVLEYDNAYRFRMQDILAELDKEALRRNPYKELNRLLSIAQSRENTQEIRDTWKLAKLAVSLYLRMDRKMRNLVVDVLCEINTAEIKMTVEDVSFAEKRKDYVFSFMTHKV